MITKNSPYFLLFLLFSLSVFLKGGCGTSALPVSPYTNSITRAPSLKYSSLYLYNPNPFLLHIHLKREGTKQNKTFGIPPKSTFNTLIAHGFYELVLVELGEKSKIALQPNHKYQLILKSAQKSAEAKKNK
ncbi:MAG: hypothetical protein ACQES9_03750 [Myxococcota bacterium]